MQPACETLPCGMKLVMMPCEAESVAVGVFVASGSRDEPRRLSGISHFIEHMLFKGTRKMRPADISRAVEGRGGNFNAFTSEEATCYYVHIPGEYLVDAVDILSDMYFNATIPEEEFAREKCVILEEKKMYDDDPSSVAMENLQASLFRGTPLAMPVIGTEKSLLAMTASDLREYIASHYTPSRTVVVVVGDFDPAACRRAVESRFCHSRRRGASPKRAAVRLVSPPTPEVTVKRDIKQTQLALGFRTGGMEDDSRYALSVLDGVLGRGMSSRLFLNLRERRGLSYDISSRAQLFRGAGMLGICAGLDATKAGAVLAAVEKEIGRLREKCVGAAELKRVKEFLTGNFRLSHEKIMSKLVYCGSSMLSFGRVLPVKDEVDRVRAVTADEIRALASRIFVDSRRAVSWVVPRGWQ